MKLKQILRLSRQSADVIPSQVYRQVTVRLHHKGVVLRGEKIGDEIKSNQYFAQEGQFIISRIDARNGAMGIVPRELHNAVVTNDFLTYDIDKAQVFPGYFDFLTSTEQFVYECIKASKGTTNRVRLQPQTFLEIETCLPSLEQQKRVAMNIESLIRRTEDAKELRKKTIEDTEILVKAVHERIFQRLRLYKHLPLNKITEETGRQIQAGQVEYYDYPYLSLENIEADTGRILEYRTCREGEIRGSAVLFGPDDVLYSKLRPYLNKVITPSFRGCATTELVVLKPNNTIVDRYYLATFLRSPQVVKDAVANSAGTKMPRTNMKWFREMQVPLPALNEQRQIVAQLDVLQAKVNGLKSLQDETGKELEELELAILNRSFRGVLQCKRSA